MTDEEVVVLTRYVKALCPAQQIDEFTSDAWSDVLRHLRLVDCQEATRRVSPRQPWIAPSDIVKEVRALRGERLERAPLMELPAGFDPDDVVGYQRAVKGWMRCIADGDQPPVAAGLAPRDMRQLESTFPKPPPA